MPCPLQKGTHPTLLVCRKKGEAEKPWWGTETDSLDTDSPSCEDATICDALITDSEVSSFGSGFSAIDEVTESDASVATNVSQNSMELEMDETLKWMKKEMTESEQEVVYDAHDLRNHPLCKMEDQKCTKRDILDNTLKKEMVFWETSRREIKFPELTKVDVTSNRSEFVLALKQSLKAVKPYDQENSAFWKWIDQEASDAHIQAIQEGIKEHLESGNGNVSAFNPIVSFCTGSHNNLSLLGSCEQAKNAMFYLIPYQAKNKFPIRDSFSIIQSSLEHVDKRESHSITGDKETLDRKVKQLLQRILNSMQVRMEVSDYQVAAALLELPSMITTDTFKLGNPGALVAFRNACQHIVSEQN